MTESKRPVPTLAAIVALLVLAVLITVTYLPGHMSGDTLAQIEQVRSGHFSDYHSPGLTSLWRLAWLGMQGTWYVLGASILLFLLSTYCLLRVAFSRVGATAVTALIAFSPFLLGYLGILSRDTWFVTFNLAAFASLVKAVPAGGHRQVRWVVASVFFASLAMAARQNAFPVAFVVCLAAATVMQDRLPRFWASTWPRRVLVALGVTIAVGATQLFYLRVMLHVRHADPKQAIYLYDLINLSLRENTVLLPRSVYPAADLSWLRKTAGTRSIDAALFSNPPPIHFPIAEDAVDDLQQNWVSAIRRFPLSYLDVRWDLWMEQVGFTQSVQWINHPYIDPNKWGYKPAFPTLDRRANQYVNWFAKNPQLDGGPLYRIWTFLLVDVIGLLYVRSPDPQRRVLGALSLSVMFYEVTIFFGAMGNQYRFTLPAVAVALIILSTALHSFFRGPASRLLFLRWTPRDDRRIASSRFGVPTALTSKSSKGIRAARSWEGCAAQWIIKSKRTSSNMGKILCRFRMSSSMGLKRLVSARKRFRFHVVPPASPK